jgi:hypothetical protein
MTTFGNSLDNQAWGTRLMTKPKGKQPSAAAKQRVRDAFDADKLAHLCTTWDFSAYADKVQLDSNGWRSSGDRFYWYKDNGSPVLAVAHLDSVQSDGTATITETAGGLLVTSGALDDRLGVYTILELLPAIGIQCDILLTTDEEMGQSTGRDFDTDKQYNWMIEFDRGGTDVVMYQYETDELTDLVEKSTAKVGIGSYSDIADLDHLGVAGFNWGVGYQEYHSPRSHAWLEDTFKMVARFEKFHRANADTLLEYAPGGKDSLYADWMVADCGDWIDLGDTTTFVEKEGGTVIECNTCGSMPEAGAA